MSLLVTRETPISYEERIKRGDRLGVLAVATFVLVILAVSFGPALAHTVRIATRSVARDLSPISNVPLDAALAAIIGLIVVAIGLAVRVRLAEKDQKVFHVR